MIKDIAYYQKIAGNYNMSNMDSQLKDIQDVMSEGFEDSVYCKDVVVVDINKKETTIKALIYETFNYTIGCNSLYLIPKPCNSVSVGCLIKYNDSNDPSNLGVYIITESAFVDQMYWRYILVKVKYEIKVYKDDILYTIPCHITTGTRNYLNTKSDNYMILPKSVFVMYCPNWGILDRNDINKRFLLNGFAYKITGIDILTKDGILFMEVNEDTSSKDDNIELDIADYYKHNGDFCPTQDEQNNTTYEIVLNPDVAELIIGDTLSLTPLVKLNGVVVDEAVDFSVSVTGLIDISKCVTYSIQNNVLTLNAVNNYENIGKIIVVKCQLSSDSTVYVERNIDISSFV